MKKFKSKHPPNSVEYMREWREHNEPPYKLERTIAVGMYADMTMWQLMEARLQTSNIERCKVIHALIRKCK